MALVGLRGCARPPSLKRPESGLAAYAKALERDDPRAAYGLLSAEQRQRLGEAEFTTRWRATVEERKNQAALVAAVLAERRVTERARVVRADGRSSVTVLEPAGWRVSAPRSSEPGPATPEEALRRFARALEQRSFDAVVGLLSDPLRALVERRLG